LLYCCHTVVTLLSHCCYTVVTLSVDTIAIEIRGGAPCLIRPAL
jgi:hypothetical protein